MEKYRMLEYLVEMLGSEKTLDEIVEALSTDEMRAVYEHICNMHDI